MTLCPETFSGRIDNLTEAFAVSGLAENPEASMSKGRWHVKPSEIARTVKSVRATGLNVQSVEVGVDGAIRVTVREPGKLGDQLASTDSANEWDDVK